MKFDIKHIILILIIIGLVGFILWSTPDISDKLKENERIIDSLKTKNVEIMEMLEYETQYSDSLHNRTIYLDSLLGKKLKDIDSLKNEHDEEVNSVLELNTVESVEFFSNWVNE